MTTQSHSSAQSASRVVTSRDAARLVGLSESTLAKLRLNGNGPVYCKLGRRVVSAASACLTATVVRTELISCRSIDNLAGAKTKIDGPIWRALFSLNERDSEIR